MIAQGEVEEVMVERFEERKMDMQMKGFIEVKEEKVVKEW